MPASTAKLKTNSGTKISKNLLRMVDTFTFKFNVMKKAPLFYDKMKPVYCLKNRS